MALLPVWLAVCAGLGAGLGIAFPIPPSAAALLVALTTLAALTAFASRRRPALFLVAALTAVTANTWATSAVDERSARNPPAARLADHRDASVRLEGRLSSDAAPDADGVRMRLSLDHADGLAADGDVALTVTGRLAQQQWPAWRASRRIAVPAALRTPARYLDEGVADDRLTLARRGLVLVGSVKSGALIEVLSNGSWIDERLADARAFIRQAVTRYVGAHDVQAAGITTAILIGDRTGLDPDVVDRLQASGTYHVIAISGGNIAIFATTVLGLLWALRVPPRAARALAALALWQYAALVGGSASVVRATLMALAYLGLRNLDLRAAPICGLSAVVAAMLVTQPSLAVDAGFLLTVGATGAIVTLARRIETAIAWPALRFAVSVLAASVATEVLLLPVSALLFGRITVAGPLLNLVAVPAMAVVEQAGLCLVAAASVWPAAADVAGRGAAVGARAMVDSSVLLDWLPALAGRVPPPSAWVIAGYFTSAALALGVPRCPSLPGRWRVVGRRVGIGGIVLAALLIVAHPQTWRVPWRRDGLLRIASIDVGQGDATLIELPDQTAVLVDAGGLGARARFDVGARVLIPAIWAQHVGWLDALLLTRSVAEISLPFSRAIIWSSMVATSSTSLR